MQLNITQEIKNEIDRNLSLHTALVELINKVKVAHGISELDDYYLNTICTEFKTGRYCFDDLTYTISNLVENKQITENDGTLLVQALCAVNDESEDYFLDDSSELSKRIKALHFEIITLTPDERKKYFDTIKSDKYHSYVFQRAVALIGVQKAFS